MCKGERDECDREASELEKILNMISYARTVLKKKWNEKRQSKVGEEELKQRFRVKIRKYTAKRSSRIKEHTILVFDDLHRVHDSDE